MSRHSFNYWYKTRNLTLIAVFIAFFVFGMKFTYGQTEPDNFRFMEIRGHSGGHLYTGEQLSSTLENGYSAIEFRYAWKSTRQNWAPFYNFPAYGVGWYSGFIGNPDILGQPNAIYGFVSFNLSKPKKAQWMIEPAVGLTYDLKPYQQTDNPTNDAIGGVLAVYFNLNMGGTLFLTRELDLTYGLDITHFSNGRSKQPNFGLNMVGLNLGARYHFNNLQRKIDNNVIPVNIVNARPEQKPAKPDSLIKKGNVKLYFAGGTSQNKEDMGTSKRYFNGTMLLEYSRRISLMHGVTGGLDLLYDASLEQYYPDMKDYFIPAAHAGYDFYFWKLAVRMQFGYYLEKIETKGDWFLRPALMYHWNDRWFAQVGLKTLDGGTADWIEWGVGMKFR